MEKALGKADVAGSKARAARAKARQVVPSVREASVSMQAVQKELESKSFDSALPAQAREVLDTWSKSKAHFAEVEYTRAVAILAFGERGDVAGMNAMYKFTTTTGHDLRTAFKPISDAFYQLCPPQKPQR